MDRKIKSNECINTCGVAPDADDEDDGAAVAAISVPPNWPNAGE